MMIPIEGLSEDMVREIAGSDPAVKAGLLLVEVVPWYTAMRRKP
ncbi:MAG TPA: hypothetical protein VFH29_10130 [Anaerolineales bacterium]|nr:hypothetical protein [Anaerolineales bacterium]